MKKIFTLLLLAVVTVVSGQNIIGSQSLELKKSQWYFRSLLAPDSREMQLVAFVADRQKVHALRYNGAVFFTDSLSANRPESRFQDMAGYSYSPRNASVYWASQDAKEFEVQSFDFGNRAVVQKHFTIDKDDRVLASYSERDRFYVVTLPEGEKDVIRLYSFNGGEPERNDLDFSAFSFATTSGKKTTLRELLKDNGLQKIDERTMTDLATASGIIKLYSMNGTLLLTLDHNSDATQAFIIAPDFTITQKIIAQPAFTEKADGNSFYHEGKLYQLRVNDDELALSATSLAAGSLIKTYRVTKNDSITFKNSPLISQTGAGNVRELRDTKRFLRRLSGADPAVSVYHTPDDILITAGGVRSVMPAANIIAGVTIGAVAIAAGGDGSAIGVLGDGSELQTLCFESLFDENFEHEPYQQMRLASDYMGEFSARSGTLFGSSMTPFQDYFIMGYYDTKSGQYVMRSFRDDAAR